MRGIFLLIFMLGFTKAFSIGFVVRDTNVCYGQPFLLKDTSTAPAGLSIIRREWNLDGVNFVTSSLDSIYVVYGSIYAPGQKYSIGLNLYYSDGTSSQYYSYPNFFYIRSVPQIDSFFVSDTITCMNVVPGITFYGGTTSVAPHGGVLTNWQIDFGDQNAQTIFGSLLNVQHNYGAQGLYTATYSVIDEFQCTASAKKDIRIIAHPTVKFEAISPRCKDSAVLYENRTSRRTDSGWQWQWVFLDSLIDTGSMGQDSLFNNSFQVVNNMDVYHTHPWNTKRPGHYQVVILSGTNQYRCFDKDTQYFRVDTTPLLVITPSIDTTICFGNSIKYTIRGSDTLFYSTFLWGDKVKGDSVVLFTPLNTITYRVYGKTPQCPPSGKDIKIRVVQPIATSISLTPMNIMRGNMSIMEVNTSAIIDSIHWSPNSSLSRPTSDSTGASPQVSTLYRATMFYSLDRYVCTHSDSAYLLVDSTCEVDSLKIPTAFTPNGDALNDEFYIKSFALKMIKTFNVYNRWGEKVFNLENVPADDSKYAWNGKMNNTGEDLPPGTYIYNISAVCKNDALLNFQGDITILR